MCVSVSAPPEQMASRAQQQRHAKTIRWQGGVHTALWLQISAGSTLACTHLCHLLAHATHIIVANLRQGSEVTLKTQMI